MYMQDERQQQQQQPNDSSAQVCSQKMQTDKSYMQDTWKPNQGTNANKCDELNIKRDKTEKICECNAPSAHRDDPSETEKPCTNTSATTVPCPASANDEYAPTYRKSYCCLCAPKSLPSLKSSEKVCTCKSPAPPPPPQQPSTSVNVCCSKSVPNLSASGKPSKVSGKSKDSSNWYSPDEETCISKVVFCPSSAPEKSSEAPVCCTAKGGETCPFKAPMPVKKVSAEKVRQCVCLDEKHDFSIEDAKPCMCASQTSSECSVNKDQGKSCECAAKTSNKGFDQTDQMRSCNCNPESDEESDKCCGMPSALETALSSKMDESVTCPCGAGNKGMYVCQCSDDKTDDENVDGCKTSESQYEDTQGVCGCTDPKESREGAGLSTIFGSGCNCNCNCEDKATSVYDSAENSERSGCNCSIQNGEPNQNASSVICTSIKPQDTDFCICKENAPHNASAGPVCGAAKKRKSGAFSGNSGRSRNRKSLQNSIRTSSRSQSVMAEVTCLCTSTQRAKLGATNRTGPPFTRITESVCPCLGVVDEPGRGTKVIWKGDKFCECESGSNNSTADVAKRRSSKKSIFSCCSCCADSDTSLPPTKSKSCPRASKSVDEAPCGCPDDDVSKKKSKKSLLSCCSCCADSNTSLPPVTSKPCSCTSKPLDEIPCICSKGSAGPVCSLPRQEDDEPVEPDASQKACICASDTKQSAQDQPCDDEMQVDPCIKCDAAQAAQVKPCCAKKRIMNLLDMVSSCKNMKIDRVEIVHQIIQELSKMMHQCEETCACMSYEDCMAAVEAGRSPAQERKAVKDAKQTESKVRLDRLEKCLESCFPPKKGPKELEIVAFEFDPDFKAKRAAAEAAEAAEAAAAAAAVAEAAKTAEAAEAAKAAAECLRTDPSCGCNEDLVTVSEYIPDPEPEPKSQPEPEPEPEAEPEPEPEYYGECECEEVPKVESAVYGDCECAEEPPPNNQIVETSSGKSQGCQADGNPLTDRESQLCEYLICRMCQICQGQAKDECNATDAQKEAHSGEGCLCCHCRAMICDNQCKTVAKIMDPIVCNPVDEMVSLYIISLEMI